MRITHFTLIGLCVVLSASVAMAKDKEPAQMDMQAMMDTYKKLAIPGEPHKQLASLAGSWTTKTKEWMDPSKPPMESTGTCEEKVLLDGRYLVRAFFEPFVTEHLVLVFLHPVTQFFDLFRRQDGAQGGEEHGVLPRLVRAIHANELLTQIEELVAVVRRSERIRLCQT